MTFHRVVAFFLLFGCLFTSTRAEQQPAMSAEARDRAAAMLFHAYDDVRKHYYDPKIGGLDWYGRYKQYSERLGNAHNLGDGFTVVAGFLSGLKDSHTYFVPPARSGRFDYGFRYTLVGNDCFITQVRPGTDAASKLHIGDRVLGINGFAVDRQDYHEVKYYFGVLAPQMGLRLNVESPEGVKRQVDVNAFFQATKKTLDLTQGGDYYDFIRRGEEEDHASRSRIVEVGDVAIWKLQEFFLDMGEVDRFIGTARKHKGLVLDLRGDGGGAVDTLKMIVGSLFDHDVKICDRQSNKETKPMIAKRMTRRFDGQLIVLVDGGSASASELLARVVQLEHRGKVIGDRSAGAVMEAIYYPEQMGMDTQIYWGYNVTDANLIMTDGKSLEKTGIEPDEILLPTAADLAAGRDPVLAHAVELAGAKLDPVEAGKEFSFEWMPL